MTGSNRTPRGPDKPEIIDAEFEEVRDDEEARDGKQSASFRDLTGWLKDDGLKAVRDLLTIAGVVMVLIIILSIANPNIDDEASTAEAVAGDADAIAASVEADFATLDSEDVWHPSMLCSDERVLENVKLAHRELMARLMAEMAQEGSYNMPSAGNPIDDGFANARITWPNGTRFVSMRETGGDSSDNVIEVRCAGALEIRDAFKLPDSSWSPAFLTFSDTTFIITAGTEGFSLDFPNQKREVDEAIFHVAGEQLPLKRLREITTGR